jgi:SPP1 family predicted phage head-tail adaptor
MSRSAGELDRKVVIQRATSTPNAYNEPELSWSDHLSVWAKRTDVSDGEKFAAGQVGSFLMTRFVIRSSEAARGIRASDRLSHEGKTYNIHGIKETQDGRFKFLEITASAEANQ